MDGVLDYIQWYGDFSFKEKPLTEVDNFILVKLTYLLMADVDFTKPRRFRELVDEIKRTTGIQGTFYGKEALVELAAESKRFGEMYVIGHEDVLDEALSAQFAAVTFDLSDTERFISFRGTDDTMAGWKEDFMISFTETEAQRRALEYLRKYVDDKRKIYVAGHSKGANLALYAAVHIEDELQDKITMVYMNDGPGLCPEVCDKSLVDKIKDRAVRFSPEYSIFGKLFEETEIPEKIVKSSEEGVFQHDPCSWCVDHGKPMLSDTSAAGSVFINQILDQWIESVSNEKRLNFVNNLFNAIDKCGIKTFSQIGEKGPFAVEKILIELLSLDKKTVRTFMKLPATVVLDRAPDEEKVKKIKKKINKWEWLPYLIMILISAVLFIIPEYTMQAGISLFVLIAIVFEFAVTIRHLHRAKWNLQEESTRVYICLVLLGIFAMLLVKEDALFFIGSVVVGVAFLMWAYRNAISYKSLCESTEKDEAKPEKIKLIIEIVLLIILGGFILVAPEDTIGWYMLFLGDVLLLDGVVNIAMLIARYVDSSKENDKEV